VLFSYFYFDGKSDFWFEVLWIINRLMEIKLVLNSNFYLSVKRDFPF